MSARERIETSLGFVDDNYSQYSNYCVVEGDLRKKNLGLSGRDIKKLSSKGIDEIWHIASSMSFAEEDRDTTFDINVNGTKHLLGFFKQFTAGNFFYVSTAMVCGNHPSSISWEDQLDVNRSFNNPYEETKALSEKMVRSWAIENPNVRTMIFRPSIVAGDSRTGKTLGFTGYYRYMRAYHVIRKGLASKHELKNGMISLPIHVPGVATASLNIVTVDYAVDFILALREKNHPGVYHITASNPETYGYWLREGLAVMGITDVQVEDGKLDASKPEKMVDIENKIAAGLSDYISYVSGEPVFDKSNSKKVLGSDYFDHPRVTKELVELLLSYAISRNFK